MAAGNVSIAPKNSHRVSDIAGAWMTALWTWPLAAGATTNGRSRWRPC